LCFLASTKALSFATLLQFQRFEMRRLMFAVCAVWLAGVGAAGSALAQSSFYFICEREDGGRHLTDNEADARKYKNCQRKDMLPPAVVMPSQRLAPRPAAAAPSPGPASFPRVEPAEQLSRDQGRRQVLETELRAEETKCANLRRDLGEAERVAAAAGRVAGLRDDIARCDSNMVSIRQELARLRAM
jgi:hypothetical protein